MDAAMAMRARAFGHAPSRQAKDAGLQTVHASLLYMCMYKVDLPCSGVGYTYRHCMYVSTLGRGVISTTDITDSLLIVTSGKRWILGNGGSIASLTWAVISEFVSYTGLEARLVLL